MAEAANARQRAVVWDVDGTLLDSGEYHWRAWRAILEAEGFPLTRERFAAGFGQRNDTILRDYFGPELTVADLNRISDTKEALYRDMIRQGGIALLPGVRRWLQRLQADGWRQAIASSAPRLNLDAILDVLEIRPFFGAIVSAEEVRHGKPDPEVFLRAAAKLAVLPSRCVVVEDAPAGIAGAKRGGMRTIGVLNSYPALEADIVVRSLEDLPVDAFEQLVPRSPSK